MNCQVSAVGLQKLIDSPFFPDASLEFRKFILDQINITLADRIKVIYTKVGTFDGDIDRYINFINDRNTYGGSLEALVNIKTEYKPNPPKKTEVNPGLLSWMLQFRCNNSPEQSESKACRMTFLHPIVLNSITFVSVNHAGSRRKNGIAGYVHNETKPWNWIWGGPKGFVQHDYKIRPETYGIDYYLTEMNVMESAKQQGRRLAPANEWYFKFSKPSDQPEFDVNISSMRIHVTRTAHEYGTSTILKRRDMGLSEDCYSNLLKGVIARKSTVMANVIA